MNLFNQLNQRYGQSYIKEVRSWEGKEHKLTRHKCHLHFNLRCLSQNIVPKDVKLNIKQFTTFQERRIICRTHRSIINSWVRQCNKIINKLQSHIDRIKTSIKNKSSNKDFKDIVNVIHKSKEKVFKITKNHQIKKFNYLQQQPRYRNMPVPDIIRKKWGHQRVQQAPQQWRTIYSTEGPQICCKFIQVTPHWVHCSYQKNLWWTRRKTLLGRAVQKFTKKTKEVLQHFKDKKGPTHNITKQEKEAIKTLREDSSWVVLTADKGVAMVVMDKSQYIEKCTALLNDTKVYKPCKDTTKKLHRDV